MCELEAKESLLNDLKTELEIEESEREKRLLEIEKLYWRIEIAKDVSSAYEGKVRQKQNFDSYFEVENLEKKIVDLQLEHQKKEEKNPIPFLKATIKKLETMI